MTYIIRQNNNVKLKSLFKKENKVVRDTFYFFGETDDLDNRISEKPENNFLTKLENLKQKIKNKEKVQVVIGISRYNFFKIHKIAEFVIKQFNQDINLNKIEFTVFPMIKILDNFQAYLEKIQSVLPKYVRIEIYDTELEDMLLRFQELSMKNVVDESELALEKENVEIVKEETGDIDKDEEKELDHVDDEHELARLLGVICETAFVGPRVLVVDPHHKCNTNCTHCWVHTPKIKHTKDFLNTSFPLDRFKKLVDDAADMNVETMILQGDGEPLLHPHLTEMLRYGRSKGLDMRFFTNGILLNEKIAKLVIEIGVKEIYCSFPAGTAETYKKINQIQKPETYNKVVKNLKRLMKLKRAADVEDPRVIVTHVIHTQNHHELVKMAQDDVYEKVDAARFYLIRLDVMNTFLKLKPDEIEEIQRQVPLVEETLKKGNVEFVDNIKFQLENYNQKDGSWCKDVFLKKGCTIGNFFNLVPAKGDVSFCCHLRTVGYLDKGDYKDIWFSERYDKWRRQAKYIKDNVNAKFLNNQILYDEHCTHCDNHQAILDCYEKLEKYGLDKYYR